jgi:crotonobetainyl-CoA:carnitine CoA-transferase CaiB-like acyl-CoA transferase
MKVLTGVKVLDLTTLLPGPLTGTFLELLGADVTKVEPPSGDHARNFPELFTLLNSEKKKVKINLKVEQGRKELYKLVKEADVLIENYKPGTTLKLQIDYKKLSSINKKLIYCSLIGYPKNHELHEFAGHDINFLGLSGILELMKNHSNQTLSLPNFQLADIAGGTYPALAGVLGGLYQAEKTNKGSHVTISLLDSIKPLYTFILKSLSETNELYSNVLSGEQACYGIYKTKDNKNMCLGAFENKFFQLFVTTLGLSQLYDSHLKTHYMNENVKTMIEQEVLTNTQAYWVERFKDIDCCFTPVLPPQPFQLIPPFYYSQD